MIRFNPPTQIRKDRLITTIRMDKPIEYRSEKTREFLFDIRPDLQQPLSRQRAHSLVSHLGCTITGETEARFLFWNPEFKEASLTTIELFIPNLYLNFDKPEQHATFRYFSFPIQTEKEFAAAVINGIPVGSKDNFGAFYQVKNRYPSGREEIIRDPMAISMPFGIHAPSEVYDLNKALADRRDKPYFDSLKKSLSADDYRVPPPVNLLEIHVQTATKAGTLYTLTHRLRQIASKLNNGVELTADEKNLTGFDAIQLMPIDPVIEHPGDHKFWDPINTPSDNGEEITVRLRKPDVLNWGYDVPIFGAAAINPSVLTTGRPDELIEFIETAHMFPRPIKVVLDVVYGHADNQALEVMPGQFFSGPNMYGQDIRFRHPIVRAMILELQKRKINYGFDGVRVDGAQDFKYYDSSRDKLLHDDKFLSEMSDVIQNVNGVRYRPWMIFEDGRPWPRDDWELASTYRSIIEDQPHAFQWAPMIFAYNTPYTYTYWVAKWWRLREMFLLGENWIGGYANHDTMRRGTQANPASLNVNSQLGNSLKMVLDNAYNNPATTLLMNGFLPGVPMDFLQALGSTPWSFIRDTDTDYAIKVVAEEAHFLDWQVTENEYRQSRFFKRLKHAGFSTLEELRIFSKTLLHLVQATDNSPDEITGMLNNSDTGKKSGPWTIDKLNSFSEAWMHDLSDYCTVDHHARYVNDKKAAFNLDVRQFRMDNPWLRKNFGEDDILSYIEPVNGSVIYYGYRKDPDSGREVAIVLNMEGQPRQVVLTELGVSVGGTADWMVALSTPNISRKNIGEPVRLSASQGLLFVKK